jgi:alpha-1,3-mannosyltransferase
MIVLAATPFLAPHNLRFRRGDLSRADECQASECELLNRDLWQVGWGRVQVVPSVQVAYDRGTAEDIADKLERQKKGLGWFEEVPGWRDDVTVSFENAECVYSLR